MTDDFLIALSSISGNVPSQFSPQMHQEEILAVVHIKYLEKL